MYIVVLILFLLFSGASFAEEQTHGFSKSNMDTSVKPCDDLYQYANGNWLKNNPIPPDRSGNLRVLSAAPAAAMQIRR